MKNTTKQLHSDRFIPVRSFSTPKNFVLNGLTLSETENKQAPNSLSSTCLKKKQLTFSKSLSTRQESVFDFLTSLPNSCKTASNVFRPLKIDCFKVIDVPDAINNFYYNSMDFSKKEYIGIGLAHELFMFREEDNMTIVFPNKNQQSFITSVRFSLQDQVLLVGKESGGIEINDVEKTKTLRYLRHHLHRVGRLQLNHVNPSIFYSGSKDCTIHVNDLRQKKACVSILQSHKSEICGLSFKQNLLASGSNEGIVQTWDVRNCKALESYDHHKGAVKALAWCPWRNNFLISGGGRKDQKIVIFDVDNKKIEKTIQVNHQITDLYLRNSTQEIVYSYTKQNKGSIKVDNYFNSRCQNKKFTSHAGRVLCLKGSKNNDNIICSLSADETLRYWDLQSPSTKVNANEIVNANFLFE